MSESDFWRESAQERRDLSLAFLTSKNLACVRLYLVAHEIWLMIFP